MVVLHLNRRFALGVLTTVIALGLYYALGSAPAHAHAGHANGQHHITTAAPGTCESVGLISASADSGCTHGPDPAPPGVNPADVDLPEAFSAASFAVCEGDGQSGQRVQVIYARASDKPDRYRDYLSSFQGWASEGDAIYQASAAETDGARHVRFVHDANCAISVLNVTLSPTGDDDFWKMSGELWDQGFRQNNRKYLIFIDRNHPDFCGQATVFHDDRAGQDNQNNTLYGYAAIYNGCWSSSVTIAHELGHNFGAVQGSAPNASRWDHCVDEWDVMCYDDGSGIPLRYACPDSNHNARLDCNHDDYFHTNPPADNYLATHWNIANSGFLGTSGSQITLSKEKSKFNGWVIATLSGFAPNQPITLSWPDMTVLAQTTADDAGHGTVGFRTPLVALGTYTVLARDAAGNSATDLLRVIPRINLNEQTGFPGDQIRVYFYGFAPDDQVEVKWYALDGSTYEVLGVVTIADNGRGTKLVTIPYASEPGAHLIRGDVIGEGRSASMSFTVIQSAQQISLSKTKSKFNGWVGATMTGFAPNATVTLTWPDGLVLAQTTTDGAGTGAASFRTPLYPLGDYEVRATDSAGNAAAATLRIIPRIKLTDYAGPAGSSIRVYLYGFAPGNRVEILWYALDGASYTVLDTVTIADNGRASRVVTIPSDAPPGDHRVRGDVIGVSRSTSTIFSVMLESAKEPTVTPTATMTPQPTSTATPEPSRTSTPLPTDTVTQEPPETSTPTPTETSTPEPTSTAQPTETLTPTETATPEPTATETPAPTSEAVLNRYVAVRKSW